MKFIKIPQHNNKDFLLVNLIQINYIAVNDKAGTSKIFLANGQTITCMTKQTTILLNQVSEYNRQILEYFQVTILEDEF